MVVHFRSSPMIATVESECSARASRARSGRRKDFERIVSLPVAATMKRAAR